MTTPHSPATPSGAAGLGPDTFSGSKRLQRLTCELYGAFSKAFRTWKLKREARKCMASFFSISEAVGLSAYSSKHSPEQMARIERMHAIRAELRNLNYPNLKTRP